MRYLLWAVVAASFAAAGCEEKACTLRGCVAQFGASWSRSDGTIPSGVHQIDVTADGETMSCTFTFAGSSVSSTCPSGRLFVSVTQASTCTEIRMGNSVSQRCDPIPGQFIEAFALQGTPSNVRIVQMVDGVVLLDQSIAPTYQVVYPNGPDCDPGCMQASASLTLQ